MNLIQVTVIALVVGIFVALLRRERLVVEQQSEVHLEIRDSTNIGGVIFGCALMILSISLAYHLVRVGDLQPIFVLVALGILALMFILGWAIAAGRHRVVVDVSHSVVDEISDFLFYRRVKTHALPGFKRVIVKGITLRSLEYGDEYRHEVWLVRDVIMNRVVIATSRNHEEAKQCGQTVAEILGLPFEVKRSSKDRSTHQ